LSSLERAKSVDPATGDVDKERSRKTGIELEFQIPVFDFGETRQREVRESYMREVNRLLETSVNVRSVARESYQRYRGAYTLARHYDRYVLPLRKIISDESLLRYNAMIVDVIPLLAEARQRINSNIMAINARRDFWLAEASLRAAIIGGGAEAGPAGGDGPAVAATAGAGP
jgi:outer membrane protein TolC